MSGHEGALERRLERAVHSIEQRGLQCLHPLEEPAVGEQDTTPIHGGGSTASDGAAAGSRTHATALQLVPVKAMEDAPIGLDVALAVAAAVRQVPQRCWDQRQDHHQSGGRTQGQVWPGRPSCCASWHGGDHVDAQQIEADVPQGQHLAGDDGHHSKTEG
jgi:hypothetical protein